MRLDLSPLLGRATFQAFEIKAPIKSEEETSDQVKISSSLLEQRLTTQELARIFFLGLHSKIEFPTSLLGHAISKGEETNLISPLARLTAKTALHDFQAFKTFLEEERRIEELRKYWTNLKENFLELYHALVLANEREKKLIVKQDSANKKNRPLA